MRRLFLAVSLLAALAHGGGRVAFAEWELTGPLAEVEFVSEGGDRLHLRGALRVGESRTLVLAHPVDARPMALRDRTAPTATWSPGSDTARGRARFVSWVERGDAAPAVLSPTLRARSLPPVERARAKLGLASVCVLGAAFAALLALRRRPLPAIVATLAGGTLAAALVQPGGGANASLRVLDGELGAARWLDTRSAAGMLVLDAQLLAAPGWLTTEPEAARLEFEQELHAPDELCVRSSRTRLHWRAWTSSAALTFESNDWCDLDRVRVRRGGSWTELGPWARGASPPSGADAGSVPGWLEAGLPQGRDVLLAADGRGAEHVWVRLTGD